jgi:hypothetical protein
MIKAKNSKLMLNFERRKTAFADLGHFISQLIDRHSLTPSKNNSKFTEILNVAKAENQWFTDENVCYALREWSKALKKDTLDDWLAAYGLSDNSSKKNIGIVMAGNIPMVGFHDFLSVLISGYQVQAKLSSNDKRLLPYFAKVLIDIEPEFESKIEFAEQQLKKFDAVIATGSNNTARYFEYYFRDKPHIIRKNRNGVAILTGAETEKEIKRLGEDIFRYFGLGCRNVSKIFMPEDFDISRLFEGLKGFESYINHHKYANNYDYNKAVYLMSDIKFLDNGFLIMKEDKSYASPIGVVNYEPYNSDDELKNKLNQEKNNIQCTIGKHKLCNFEFGEAQTPNLSDYADGVDTIKFLKTLD